MQAPLQHSAADRTLPRASAPVFLPLPADLLARPTRAGGAAQVSAFDVANLMATRENKLVQVEAPGIESPSTSAPCVVERRLDDADDATKGDGNRTPPSSHIRAQLHDDRAPEKYNVSVASMVHGGAGDDVHARRRGFYPGLGKRLWPLRTSSIGRRSGDVATRLVPALFFFQKSTMNPLSAAFMSLSLGDELQNRSHEVSWASRRSSEPDRRGSDAPGEGSSPRDHAS